MIKIAFIIDTIDTPGAGTEKQLLMLLRNLDRDKLQPYLVCLRDSQWLKSQSLPFPVIKYKINKIFRPGFIKGLFRFIKFLKKEKCDIVQTFFSDGNVFGTIGARLAGCRIIISSRRNMGYRLRWIDIFILKLLRRWTSHYLANSKAAAEYAIKMEGVDSDKISVIYNGMELERFNSISYEMRTNQREKWKVKKDDLLIGSVSNLRSVKNIGSLIETANVLNGDFGNLRYVVVGEGPDRAKLQALINNNGLADRFQLVGSYEDITSCLAAFDICVICSRSEAFSNSLIEYMAAGRPVVASDVGGNKEAVEHNETGLLYHIGNDRGLEMAIRKILKDSVLAAKIGENAKNKAFSEYDLKSCIQHHEEYYLARLS